jgi:hypothetical protein
LTDVLPVAAGGVLVAAGAVVAGLGPKRLLTDSSPFVAEEPSELAMAPQQTLHALIVLAQSAMLDLIRYGQAQFDPF